MLEAFETDGQFDQSQYWEVADACRTILDQLKNNLNNLNTNVHLQDLAVSQMDLVVEVYKFTTFLKHPIPKVSGDDDTLIYCLKRHVLFSSLGCLFCVLIGFFQNQRYSSDDVALVGAFSTVF